MGVVRYIQLFHWGWDTHGASASEAFNKGFDHEKLNFPTQRVNPRLSNITKTGTKVVKIILA